MQPNRLLAGLIAVAAILFAVGASIEKSDSHTEPADAAHVEGVGEAGAGGRESAEVHESETATGEDAEGETLFGIDLESTPLIVLAVIGSLALGAGAWRKPDSRGLLTLVSIAMLAFALLDIREVVHQLDADEAGLALIAAAVAALHLAAAGLAWRIESQLGARAATA
jgi:hypothetical protein